MTKVKVWDLLTRLFHWSLVLAFAIAWLTEDDFKDLHELAGYTVLGLIAFRVIYGFIGPKYSRFSDFVKSPEIVKAYLFNLLAGRHESHLGHNPAAGYMVIALLASVTCAALTGWMMEIDMFWGYEWVEEIHEAMASLALGLVYIHIAGVIVMSLVEKQNLAKSMLTGLKQR